MSKAARVLDLLPSFYGATDPHKRLGAVVAALAAPLEEADTLLFRIQRAHRLRVADDAADILRLAALLGLTRWHFEDILADDAAPYDDRLARLRERVTRLAALHLKGLGTPWAVVEAAAVFLESRIAAGRGGAMLRRLDPAGYSHRAELEHRFAGAPRSAVHLHENPLRRRRIEPAERWPMGSWTAQSENVEPAPVSLLIEGAGDRTVLPEIFCATTGESVRFHGVVPAGQALVINDAGATLDGRPVDDFIVRGSGGAYELGEWDTATVGIETAEPAAPFGGDPATLAPPAFRRRRAPLLAPPSRSDWFFRVAEGVWDRSAADFAVFAVPREPIGRWDADHDFDACVFDFPASGVTGMSWGERIPCAFKLVLPPHVPAAGDDEEPVWLSPDAGRIGAALARFRAAGVRAFVDTAQDAWTLGTSVLRDVAADDGAGIDYHATRLHDAAAELYVPFHPEAQAVGAGR
jgi:hypothetical protein